MKSLNKSGIVLLTALLAGTLDGIAAVVHFLLSGGEDAASVFRFVASGVFGNSAFEENGMAVYGIIFHYLIAFIWVVLYFQFYPRLFPGRSNKYAAGILYGLLVWLVMNLVVLPLSNTPPLGADPLKIAISAAIIMCCVGLPIALMFNRWRRNKGTADHYKIPSR